MVVKQTDSPLEGLMGWYGRNFHPQTEIGVITRHNAIKRQEKRGEGTWQS